MAIKKLNKKALFFTLIAIFLLFAAFSFFALTKNIPEKDNIESTEARITRINRYIENVEDSYIPRITANLGYIKAKELDANPIGDITTEIKQHIENNIQTHLDSLKLISEQELNIDPIFEDEKTITVTSNAQTESISITTELTYTIETDLGNWNRNPTIISNFSISQLTNLLDKI